LVIGEKYDLIKKSGSSYSYTPDGEKSKTVPEIKLGRGYDASRQYLKENPKLRDEIFEKVKQALLTGATAAESEPDDENGGE